ncbi:MAG: MMPL family transporter [Acholeplasmataceae bacterium]|jgi:predicted RND superfamily exporter protein|nr:MMPL family transporter [Acholeplasmataceae bacterium]
MKNLTRFISKYPVKTFIITFILLIVLIVGATQIKLKTGNDTLISDTTNIYQDNEEYQSEFGKDPIILIFDQETTFDAETLELMHLIQEDIHDLEGIFAINSPVTVINQISITLYDQTQAGLAQMSTGLLTLSSQLNILSSQIQSGNSEGAPDINTLTTNLNQLIQAQNQLNTGLVNMFIVLELLNTAVIDLKTDMDTLKTEIGEDPLLTEELELTESMITQAVTLNQSLTQLLEQESISLIPEQTVVALNQFLMTLVGLSESLNTQLVAMQTLAEALLTMGTTLEMMGSSLAQIQTHFNAFEPGFPSSPETLHMMIFDELDDVKPMFTSFIVNETQLRMVIILSADINDDQIDTISNTISNRVEQEGGQDDVLISGKPILDRSIKSSMMDSMQYMMMFAVIIMVLILVLIYKVRMRLLPIVMILLAVVATVGVMGWLSIGLTMVSMAVFPVLIGLGIDYFIQFQTRYEEERK